MTELSKPGGPQHVYSLSSILYGPLLSPRPGRGNWQNSPHHSKDLEDIRFPSFDFPGLHSKLSSYLKASIT